MDSGRDHGRERLLLQPEASSHTVDMQASSTLGSELTPKETFLEMTNEELQSMDSSSTEWEYLTGNYGLIFTGFALLALHILGWYTLFAGFGYTQGGLKVPDYASDGIPEYWLFYVRLATLATFLYVVGPIILLGHRRFNSPWLLMYWVFFAASYGILLVPHLMFVCNQQLVGGGTVWWITMSIQELMVPLILWGFAYCLHHFRRIGLRKNLYYGLHILAGFPITTIGPIYYSSAYCPNAVLAVVISLLIFHLVIINYLATFWSHAEHTAVHQPQNYRNKNLMVVVTFTLLFYISFAAAIFYFEYN